MNVVIRPSPDVFRRRTRVLVVFGMFRRYDMPDPFLPGEEVRLTDIVSKARNYRVQLAFCRRVTSEGNSYPGSWLPGCRPRIADMVFNFSGMDCYSHPEMHEALLRLGGSEIAFSGPSYDSDFVTGLRVSAGLGLKVKRVYPQIAVQNCSTGGSTQADSVYFPTQGEQIEATGYGDWIRNLRTVDSIE